MVSQTLLNFNHNDIQNSLTSVPLPFSIGHALGDRMFSVMRDIKPIFLESF